MRIFLLVIDSFGIGEMPDADLFHDEGSNTYGNLYARTGVDLPNLIRFGLNNIDGVANLSFPDGKILRPCAAPVAAYGRMAEKTFAKDTTAGHYEIAGVMMKKPYGIYKTFPAEIVSEIEQKANVEFMGNEVASGTEIIQRLGEEHLRTKRPILYTSQDSVMQIAADISVVPLSRLYEICEIAREIMVGRLGGRPRHRASVHARRR